MKTELYNDFFRNLVLSQAIRNDDFFPNELIKRVNNQTETDYQSYQRQLSSDEESVITQEGFNILLFWVNTGEIDYIVFERFMSILITYKGRLRRPIDEFALPGMIELMGLIEFKDHVIYSTIDLYMNSPDLLRNRFQAIH